MSKSESNVSKAIKLPEGETSINTETSLKQMAEMVADSDVTNDRLVST